MKTKYIITKEKSKKVYLERLKIMDVFYFILANILFFMATFELIKYNILAMIVLYIIYMLVFVLILFVFNHLFANIMLKFQEKDNPYGTYLLEIKDDKLLWGTKKEKIEINLNDMLKINLGKKCVDIYVLEKGRKTCFAFYKEYFVKEDFETFKSKLEPYKK